MPCSRAHLLTRPQPAISKRDSVQNVWLVEKFPQFLDHQVNRTLGQFFPPLYEEYFSRWPPTPTEEDITEAGGNTAVATARARQTEEHVRDFELTM
jgi:hypothetical protein